jgi:hypothetical protein
MKHGWWNKMRCPECGKVYLIGQGGYGESNVNPIGLPKDRDIIDSCVCTYHGCGIYLLMSNGDIYKWLTNPFHWELLRKAVKNTKYIGGYKVLQ